MGGTTVKISPETLIKQAEATGFRPDMLEKVGLLLQLLDATAAKFFPGFCHLRKMKWNF